MTCTCLLGLPPLPKLQAGPTSAVEGQTGEWGDGARAGRSSPKAPSPALPLRVGRVRGGQGLVCLKPPTPNTSPQL